MKADELKIVGLRSIPEVAAEDDLARLIFEAAEREGQRLVGGSAVVVAQKIVSKAEGRVVDLRTVEPSPQAESFGRKHGRDPRLVEVILQQTRRVVRMERGIMIVETHHGLVCANAGVDQSNVPGEHFVTLLPCDPDASAESIRQGLRKLAGCDLAVIVSDTFGRPWREGLANVAIGAAGFQPLKDYRGRKDRHGRVLRGTVIAVADELASAAGLLMGKADGAPVVLISGVVLPPGAGSAREILRPPDQDLFR